ncbi:S8 family serine peptidase [Thermobifida halotolerans]|uniref:S8 family serine peptidase n=1 Tax=Thermobifida halotolerans TaxID=483545 RepID=A0AA97LWC9_9ACTN|nr:S8 family serine peptidase [Thermobifida halotolerans]UOE19279.1 S8 family serine peptidase [Thermobifida halotolerans]
MRTTRTRTLVALGVCAALAAGPLAAPSAADVADLGVDQWGLDRIGVDEAWEESRGSGVTVALLDTGVVTDHPDLDSVTVGPDLTGQDPDPGSDGYGVHGTMMAGIIAASGHGVEHTGGAMGVAPQAEILSIRIATEADGPERAAVEPGALAEGIRRAVDEGAQVVSIPLAAGGFSAQADDAEREAVDYALDNGVVVIVSGGADGEAGYPAAYPGVLAVGSVGSDGTLSDFSSRGEHIALTAPGEEITVLDAEGGYTTVTGSDAAAAFTAGVAALIRAEYPQLQPHQVVEALTEGAEAPAEQGQPGYGAGTLSASGAMAAAGTTAENVPPFDPELAEQLADDPLVPRWVLWAGGTALLVLMAVVGLVVLWRRSANPYDLPRREPESTAESGRRPVRGRRRRGRGRRGVSR